MPTSPRHAFAIAAVIGLSLGLSGCETADVFDKVTETVHDFNPFGTAKRPLPGERRAVFPTGVPGVEQGVPQNLVRGARPKEVAAEPSQEGSTGTARAGAKQKARPNRRPRATAAAAPEAAAPPPTRREAAEAAPPPRKARPVRRVARRPAPAAAEPTSGQAANPAPAPAASAPASRPAPTPAAATSAPAPTTSSAQSAPAWPAPSAAPAPTAWPDPPKPGAFTR